MTISRERTAFLVSDAHGAQFATEGARRGATCPWIALQLPGEGPTALHLIAEPVEQTPRAIVVGASILAAIREVFVASKHDDPVVALTEALDAANHALYQQNRTASPGQRVVLGLTCLAIRDRELLICQLPPTQLLLSQGGTAVMLPELGTWRRDYQPHGEGDQQGLGATALASPALFRASLEAGDLITLCSSNLAARLAQDELESALHPLLGTEPRPALDFLADLTEHEQLDPAYGAVLAPPPAAGRDAATEDGGALREDDAPAGEVAQPENWFARGLREMRERSRIIVWPGGTRRRVGGQGQLRVVRDGDAGEESDDADPPRPGDRPLSTLRLAPQSEPADERWAEEGDEDGWAEEYPDPLPGDSEYAAARLAELDQDETMRPGRRSRGWGLGIGQIAWSLVACIVLVAGTILERLLPPRGGRPSERYLDRSRSRTWPLGSLERWSGRVAPTGRFLPPAILAVLVGVTVIFLLSMRNHQIRSERERFDGALARVTGAREAALASPDRLAAHSQILALPAALDAIPSADKPGRPERIAAERAAILAALDRVDGIERLPAASIQLLAPVPAVSGGTPAARAQVVVGGGQQYVLANGIVYQVDGRAKALTKLLTRGDTIGGLSVGSVIGITWRVDSLVVVTETQAFVRDGSGWAPLPLAAGGRKPAAIDSFDGNLYFLEPERGQIAKYPSGAYAQASQPWSNNKVNGDLNVAVDMAIDKGIDVLLSDGRILDFFQGEMKAIFTPLAVPPLAGATALGVAPDGKWLFVIDPAEGRLIRLGRDGGVSAVYKPADGAKSFVGARDVAVDEAAGVVYVLTDEGLLSVRLP